jgi:tetratricopeptide (TPR) repeat protein
MGWGAMSLAGAARQVVYLLFPDRHRSVTPETKEVLQEAGLAGARQSQQYYFAGQVLPMLSNALLAVNLAERAEADLSVAVQYSQLGYLSGVVKLRRLSQAYFRRARENGSRHNDLQGLVAAVYQEVAYYVGEAKWADARRVGVTAMELAEQLGNPQELETTLTVLGHGDFCAGDFTLNYRRAEQLLESARARAHQQHVAWGLYSLGRNLLARGDVDGAIELFEEARPILAQLSDRGSSIICLGLLGLAYLRRREYSAARATADSALQLIRGLVPAVFPTGHGYAALAETYLGLMESPEQAKEVPRAAAWEVCAYLWTYAALFPIGRPAAFVLTAQALRLSGRTAAARWFAKRGARIAGRLEMPFEGAMALLEQARLAASDPSLRTQRLGAVREAFLRLGCAYHVALVERETRLSDPAVSRTSPGLS